jgi:outer membrane protein assembly factor BamE (lipoprotein component of BamABCDE complex)
MKSILIVTFIACAALFSGCASAGTKVDQAAVSKIQKGKTSKAEVVALLGSPMSASLTGDGKEVLVWS